MKNLKEMIEEMSKYEWDENKIKSWWNDAVESQGITETFEEYVEIFYNNGLYLN